MLDEAEARPEISKRTYGSSEALDGEGLDASQGDVSRHRFETPRTA